MRREYLIPINTTTLADLVKILLLTTRRTERLSSVRQDGDELHVLARDKQGYVITIRECEEDHS